jgi:site-specific DNA recombinase
MTQTVGYIRVSSREQAENFSALDQQRARIEPLVDLIYCDIASGTDDLRSQFNQLLSDARKRQIKTIYLTRLDRLSRRSLTLIRTLEEFEKLNIKVVALDDQIDSSSAIGKFSINMSAALAQMESDRLSERIKHGWAYLRKQVKPVNPPFGYTILDNKYCFDIARSVLIPNTNDFVSKYAIAIKSIDIFLDQKTLRGTLRIINDWLGIKAGNPDNRMVTGGSRNHLSWSHCGLKRWLLNPVLRGHSYYPSSKEFYPNTHEDILITESIFQDIQTILADNRDRKGFGSSKPKYLFSGLIICGECGATQYVQGAGGNRRYSYYQCRRWGDRTCTNSTCIREEKIYDFAMTAIASKSRAIAKMIASQEMPTNLEVVELEKQLDQLNRIGDTEILREAKRQIMLRIDSLRANTEQLTDDRDYLLKLMISIENGSFWSGLPLEEQRLILKQIIKAITVTNREITAIAWNPLLN